MEKAPLFITYLNAPLKENPAYLLEVCDAVAKEVAFGLDSADHFSFISKFIILFAHKNRPELVDSAYACQDENTEQRDLRRIIINAGEAVFGFRNNYCETTCPKRKRRGKIFGLEAFTGEERLKCFQCDQAAFKALIDGLISKKEFSEIPGFLPFINFGYRYLEFCIKEVPSGDKRTAFKTKIEKHVEFQPDHPLYLKGDSHGKFAFLNLLDSLVSYSLSEYLLKEDRRKIKKCSNCGQYYIAKTVKANQKFCSDRCKTQNHWPPERRKEYMKHYRERKMNKVAKKKPEYLRKEIERFMENLGIPEEEVIQLMKDDPTI